MGWSVGYRPPAEADLIDEILLAAGKALYLANVFEAKCKAVLRAADFVQIAEADPVQSLEEVAARLPRPKMLDATLRDLSSRLGIDMSGQQSSALTKARLARNYIAHEGAAAIGDLGSYNVPGMLGALRRLRAAVADLANGDNIVSAWVYQIEEPREPLPSIPADYLALVDRWVFGHVPPEWLDTSSEPDHQRPRTVRAALSYTPWYTRPDRHPLDADDD